MKYTFKEIAFNSTEKRIPVEEDRFTYIGLEHLDSRKLSITRYGSDVPLKGEKLVMRKGDILFGKRNTYLKRVAIAPFDGLFSAHGMVLRPNEKVISREFFPFFLSSDYFLDEAIRISVGSLSPTVNWKDLKDLEFEIPDFDRQHKIAEVLSAANNLKESYEAMITATDEMVKSQFIEKTSLSSSPSISLKEVVSIVRKNINPTSGKTYTLYSFQAYDNQQIPEIVDGGEIRSCKLNLTPNTVLYNKLNVRLCRVWNVREIATTNNICSTEFIPLKMDENVLLQEYLVYFLTSEAVTKAMMGVSQGTSNSQKRIAPEALLKLEIPLPPIEVQKEFVAVYKKSDKSKFELKQAIEKIDKVMRVLMQ